MPSYGKIHQIIENFFFQVWSWIFYRWLRRRSMSSLTLKICYGLLESHFNYRNFLLGIHWENVVRRVAWRYQEACTKLNGTGSRLESTVKVCFFIEYRRHVQNVIFEIRIEISSIMYFFRDMACKRWQESRRNRTSPGILGFKGVPKYYTHGKDISLPCPCQSCLF